MAFGRWACALLVIAAALFAPRALELHKCLGFGKRLAYVPDDACIVIGDNPGSEDFAMVRPGLVLVSAGDLNNAQDFGSQNAEPGEIYMIDLGTAEKPWPRPVRRTGWPAGRRFQPHGIFYSTRTGQVLAVNHMGGDDGSAVEVFRLNGANGPNPQSSSSLAHLRSVSSPQFKGNHVPNDVVEGQSASEFYVTTWLNFALPANGKLGAPAAGLSLKERLWARLSFPMEQLLQLGGYRGATVVRCRSLPTVPTTSKCSVAVAGFGQANGITATPDGQTLFVTDAARAELVELDRAQDGALVRARVIDLPHVVDNVEFVRDDKHEGSGYLLMGANPIGYRALARLNGQNVSVPGGALKAWKQRDGNFTTEDLLMHSGERFPTMTSAAHRDAASGAILLGGPDGRGVLLCRPQGSKWKMPS